MLRAVLATVIALLATSGLGETSSSTQPCSVYDLPRCSSSSYQGNSLAVEARIESGVTGPSEAAVPTATSVFALLSDPPCVELGLDRCEIVLNAPGEAEEEPAPGRVPITIADLAAFTPAVGELIVQPENWGVLGIPTNFVATATDHVQDGTLLGQPIQVRWRPTAFTFDYGDGSVMTTSNPGAQWQGTDDDWTTTSTSHEYQARGEYTASVTITFEADIASASGWTTVPGTLDLAAPAEAVRIFQAQTVLTRGDCIDYPGDPGCSP
jgi:hypothetical protein